MILTLCVTAHVQTVEDSCAPHAQKGLLMISLTEVHRVGDDIRAVEDFVALIDAVRGAAGGNPRQNGARLTLMTGNDGHELVLALLHHAPHRPVDGLAVSEHRRALRETDKLHLLGSARISLHGTSQKNGDSSDLVSTLRNRLDTRNVG